MKKNYILWSVIVATLMAICSCSSNGGSDLLNLVPADAEYVVITNPRAIVVSAGGQLNGSELTLPAWLNDQLTANDQEDVADFNELLKKSGVNTESMVVAGSMTKNYYICVVSIADKGKFVKFVKNEMEFDDEDKEDGMEIFCPDGNSKNQCAIITGSYAYIFYKTGYRDINAKRTLINFIEDAKSEPFGKTSMAKFISSGSVFGWSMKLPREVRQVLKDECNAPSYIADLFEGYYCVKWSLTDNAIEAEITMFDEDGKTKDASVFEKIIDIKGKVSNEALAYLGKNETAVMALSAKDVDWDGYIDMIAQAARMSRSDRQIMVVAGDYLKNIDGTVAAGFGLTNGLQSIANLQNSRDVMDQFDATIVIETKDGKASKLMSEITDLLDQARMQYTGNASTGISVSKDGVTVYLAAKDNFLIASNHKIEKSGANPAAKAFDFTRYLGAMAITLDKNNQLLKDLDVDSDINFSYAADVENSSLKIRLEVKGGQGKGVIEKIANICIDISKQDFSKYFPSYIDYEEVYGDAYYDEFIPDDYDWSQVDTAVYY